MTIEDEREAFAKGRLERKKEQPVRAGKRVAQKAGPNQPQRSDIAAQSTLRIRCVTTQRMMIGETITK